MEAISDFEAQAQRFADVIAAERAAASSPGVKAISLARILLAKVPGLKSPEALQTQGFQEFLKAHGITECRMREAMSSVRRESAAADITKPAEDLENKLVSKPKLRRPGKTKAETDPSKIIEPIASPQPRRTRSEHHSRIIDTPPQLL